MTSFSRSKSCKYNIFWTIVMYVGYPLNEQMEFLQICIDLSKRQAKADRLWSQVHWACLPNVYFWTCGWYWIIKTCINICNYDKPKRWWEFGDLNAIFKVIEGLHYSNAPEEIDICLEQTWLIISTYPRSLIIIWAGANALVGIQGVRLGWWGDISFSLKNISCLPLMVKATMPSILNTVRNIFMRLYASVEEVVTMCLVYKIWWPLCSYPPPPPPKNFFFLDLDSLSKFTYQRAQN